MKSLITVIIAFLCIGFHDAQGQSNDLEVYDHSLDSLLNITITTASKQQEVATDAPASVTIITSDDISRFGYRTLGEVLSTVRSFYASYDRNYTYIGVRGFSRPTDYNNRILLLINGNTINEGFYGLAPFGTDFGLDLVAVDRIEIVRGPGSVLYGSGAMLAVVNVITKNGAIVDKVHLAGEAGNPGRAGGSLLLERELFDGLHGLLSAQWTDTKGQDLYFGEYDSDSTNHGIATGLDWDRSYGLFTNINYKALSLQAMLTSREKGIPTGSYETEFNNSHAKTLDRFSFIEAKFTKDIDANKGIMVRSHYDHYRYAGVYPYDILERDANTTNRIGGEFQFRWDLSSKNRFVSGIEYINTTRADYRAWDDNMVYFDGNYPFTTFSVYLQDEHQLTDNLSVTLGLRRETHSIIGSSVVPRAAIVFHPASNTTLKLLYGQAYRSPSVYELEYAVDGFKKSNELQREKITTTELEWTQRWNNELYGVASLYTYTMKDLIDQRTDPVDSLFQFQNVGKVVTRGFEYALIARLNMGLNAYINYTYEYATDVENDSKLSNFPMHMAKLGLEYKPLEFLRTALEMQYQTGRLTVQGTSTKPFLVTNLNLTTTSSGENQSHFLDLFRVSLLVRNLFNIVYETPGGFEHRQAAILQNGREYLLKLELSL